MMQLSPIHLTCLLTAALFAASCATGSTPAGTQQTEQTQKTSSERRVEQIPDEKRAELEPKLCRAALDYLEANAEGVPPEDCERVIMRPTQQLGGGEEEGYLVTVVVGEDRRHIELGAVVGPDGSVDIRSLKSAMETAAAAKAKLDIRNLQSTVNEFYANRARLPESLDELAEQPDQLIEEVPSDPWGHPFVYRKHSESEYELFSAGPDGQPDTPDDVGDKK